VHDILLQGTSYRALILLNPLLFCIGVAKKGQIRGLLPAICPDAAVERFNRRNNMTGAPLAAPVHDPFTGKSVSHVRKTQACDEHATPRCYHAGNLTVTPSEAGNGARRPVIILLWRLSTDPELKKYTTTLRDSDAFSDCIS